MLKTLDFTTAYFGVLLGQCALISFFLFPLIFLLTEVSTSVYEISNITAEKPLKIRCFQLFIIFDNVVPLYYLYF